MKIKANSASLGGIKRQRESGAAAQKAPFGRSMLAVVTLWHRFTTGHFLTSK
jgi:hypothetical protein